MTLGAALALLLSPAPAHAVTEASLTSVTALERLPVPDAAGPLTVRVDPLRGRVELTGGAAAAGLAAKLAAAPGQVCRTVEPLESGARLVCRTRRIAARLITQGRQRLLELRELRGLPFEAGPSGPPSLRLTPEQLGDAGGCPGREPAARAECALAAGNRGEARRLLLEAVDGPQGHFAVLRLGDLSAQEGDRVGARAWYKRISFRAGPVARVAAVRLCELDAACIEKQLETAYASGAVAEPWRTELELREVWTALFLERPARAAHLLRARLSAARRPPACAGAEAACAQIARALLERPGETAEESLAIYFALSDRERGAEAADLARAAAERAVELGAPNFAANLLTSTAGFAGAARGAQLARAAQLYLQSGDRVRARVVVDYARDRLGAKAMRSPPWSELAAALDGEEPAPALSFERLHKEAQQELARAAELLAEARTVASFAH